MTRRLVLYNPPAVFYTMPLGLLGAAQAVDRARWTPEVVDGRFFADPIRALLDRLEDADALGVTVLTGPPLGAALSATRAARARFPGLRIVWGGWHPSLFPAACLEGAPIDAVIAGAGQRALPDLLDAWAAGADPTSIPGVHARRAGGEITSGPPAPLPDLDALPPLDYGLIDVDAWFARKGRRQLDFISSIGCRFRCGFCADPQVYRRDWTGLSPQRLGAELGALAARHRVTDVAFQDETFFTRRPRIEAFCDTIERERTRFAWTATLRADQGARLPEDTLRRCRDAGFTRAIVGVESAWEPMLVEIRKDVRMEQVWETAERLARLGVAATWNFIVGFAGEPVEAVAASLDAARRLRRMSPRFDTPVFFYKPYPGSPTAEAVERAGFPLPRTLEGWATFDFVGAPSPWMDPGVRERVERFRFYQRWAYGPRPEPWKWPLRAAARVRVRTGRYAFPVEMAVVERVRPGELLT